MRSRKYKVIFEMTLHDKQREQQTPGPPTNHE